MALLGRKRDGVRLIALLFLLDVVTQCSGSLELITTEVPDLEEDTTAAPSTPEIPEGKDQFSFRTNVTISNQVGNLETLSFQRATASKPLAKAQLGGTAEDSVSASSKMDKDALHPTVTLSHAVETITPTSPSTAQPLLREASTIPNNADLVTTSPSETHSSLPVPTKDNDIAHALQDAAETSTPTDPSFAISNATPSAMSGGLLGTAKEDLLDVITSDSKSHTIEKENVTTEKSKMPAPQGTEAPTVPPGTAIHNVTTGRPQTTVRDGRMDADRTEIPNITTGRTQATVSEVRMDADKSTSSETPAVMTTASGIFSPMRTSHWYIIVAVVVLAVFILVICFVWNVRRRRFTGSTSFHNTHTKKNKKGGEDAWAGPVQIPEENGMPVDVAMDDEDPSGKRLTLTTFFNKRKSRQCSVVLEEVTTQPVKSTKDETLPLLTPNSNGQANGSVNTPQDTQNISPTSKESSATSEEQEFPLPPEAEIQTIAVPDPPPVQTPDIETLPPPPSPPPEADFAAPPPSPEMQASETTI